MIRTSATVHPARLSLGFATKAIAAGVRPPRGHAGPQDRRDATGSDRGGRSAQVTPCSRSTARPPSSNRLSPGTRGRLEPHGADRAGPRRPRGLGWTGGEPIADGRTLLHYLSTTRDGRIAFGWGGGRMALGPAGVAAGWTSIPPGGANGARGPPALLPAARRAADHSRVGRPDRRLPHPPPEFGSCTARPPRLRFTGNGVGPSYLGGGSSPARADRRTS